jgi:xanthine/uracil permease
MLNVGYTLMPILMPILMPTPSAYERATACVVSAISFLIVGLCSLLLGNVPVAVGLLAGSLFWLLVALFYLTKEQRQKRQTLDS